MYILQRHTSSNQSVSCFVLHIVNDHKSTSTFYTSLFLFTPYYPCFMSCTVIFVFIFDALCSMDVFLFGIYNCFIEMSILKFVIVL